MHRIVIIGSTGSGKSYLARQLGKRLGLPFYDMDDYYWLPNWQPRDAAGFLAAVSQATAGTQWIVTGNYSMTRDIVWKRADTLIWLDYTLAFTFYQLTFRTWRNLRTKRQVCNGNIESWKMQLSKRSIFLWLCKTFYRNRKQYGAFFKDPSTYPNLKLLRFRTPEATQAWFDEL